jgi:O-antigen/teichoic acid export membrane protein
MTDAPGHEEAPRHEHAVIWRAGSGTDPPVGELGESLPDGDGDSAMRGAVRSVGKSAVVKFVLLPVSAVLGILITRVIVDNYGIEAFAQYGLLVTIGTLLPFADLGMAAAVMNAVAEAPDPKSDLHVRRTITTATRMLIISGSVLFAAVVLVSLVGGWSTILGDGLLPDGGAVAAAICVAMIAITLPIGIGQRILTALGRNHITVLLVGLQSPIVLLTLLLFVRTDLDLGAYVAVIPYVATFVISALAVVFAARRIRPTLGLAIRDVRRPRQVPGTTVFDVAWPMLIQMIALPIAMQSDRLVLSHLTDSRELGRYNLAAQMFLPIWQITSAAGVALWPVFARARSSAEKAPSPVALSVGFGALASIAALSIAIVSPFLADVASGGQIEIPIELVVVFAALMVLQAAKYPLGMYLTDAAGLRYQAKMILLMLPVNLGLSLALASRFGAVGPVVGSFFGVGVFQLTANLLYVRRRIRTEPA